MCLPIPPYSHVYLDIIVYRRDDVNTRRDACIVYAHLDEISLTRHSQTRIRLRTHSHNEVPDPMLPASQLPRTKEHSTHNNQL